MPDFTPYFILYEYRWDGTTKKYRRDTFGWTGGLVYNPDTDPSATTRRSEHVFYFLPRPNSIRKNTQMEWRISHSGTKRLKKARYRNRETVEYRLSGSFSESIRMEFEYYLKQESKYLVRNHYMQNPQPEDEDYDDQVDIEDFVIIKSANFSGAGGTLTFKDVNSSGEPLSIRERRVDYEIILERVTKDDVNFT